MYKILVVLLVIHKILLLVFYTNPLKLSYNNILETSILSYFEPRLD
jgi:hypothetical protein